MPGGPLAHDIAALVQEICLRVGPEAARWLEGALAQADDRLERAHFVAAYAGAARRLRPPASAGQERSAEPGLVERARAALLEAALRALPADSHVALVRELYRRGDSDERRCVLRSLPRLAAPERFASLAIDACRSNVPAVFEAIACENPYPARHFPAQAFQQLVLKALFTGVPLERVQGLETRRSAELARMAADYASELRAAGRPVSRDVERLARGAPAAGTGGT
jgi:hypothetical protein